MIGDSVLVLPSQTDIVDDIPTVKFAFIHWVGDGVKPLTRAKVTPHKGAIEEQFYVSPFSW